MRAAQKESENTHTNAAERILLFIESPPRDFPLGIIVESEDRKILDSLKGETAVDL
jgi:hypothetical protein